MAKKKKEILKNLTKYLTKEFLDLEKILISFVKENQKDKGYIDVQNKNGDNTSIYVFTYNETDCQYVEVKVYGIKVENNILYVCTEPEQFGIKIVYDDEDFKKAEWETITGGFIKVFDALYSITEVIEEYV